MKMNKRDLLLLLIRKLQERGIESRRAIVKCLFLLKKEYSLDEFMKFYSFYPYKQGPFSQACYSDLRALKQEGLIDEKETRLTEKGMGRPLSIGPRVEGRVDVLLNRFESEPQITRYVYSNYPEYAIKSKLVKQARAKNTGGGFYTIGYEQRDIDSFLDVLIQHQIDTVIDVRNNPFSMNFSFMQKKLIGYLDKAGMGYKHIPELGIESEHRKNLESKEDYERLFQTYREQLPAKKEHMDEIVKMGKNERVALLCFERDVSSCHRREIANQIRSEGYTVVDL
jgi:uncharacterized protein (DUF488 family)